jgi:transposase-like protein
MSSNGKRRKWSAADKLRIVLAGMQPGVEISDLCRENRCHEKIGVSWVFVKWHSVSVQFSSNKNRHLKSRSAESRLPGLGEGFITVVSDDDEHPKGFEE